MGNVSKGVEKSRHSSRSRSEETDPQVRQDMSRQKATFENLISEFQSDRYSHGIDAASAAVMLAIMLATIYHWLVFDPNAQIRIPNAVGKNPKFSRIMWPQCAIVETCADSSSRFT
ncbi:hypothetical protein BJ878DRAFT_547058 [Calycina marina]|uniref:Uncharacterized protein n=1 Tax=Calycina marina TaxID=1763456 RepID=A0A9P7YUT8_9HELO|nr:hypothetical protein BJ878DRAFT_547058 [Calycina marina]